MVVSFLALLLDGDAVTVTVGELAAGSMESKKLSSSSLKSTVFRAWNDTHKHYQNVHLLEAASSLAPWRWLDFFPVTGACYQEILWQFCWFGQSLIFDMRKTDTTGIVNVKVKVDDEVLARALQHRLGRKETVKDQCIKFAHEVKSKTSNSLPSSLKFLCKQTVLLTTNSLYTCCPSATQTAFLVRVLSPLQ